MRLLAAARQDIERAVLWYETAHAGLGDEMRIELDLALARVSALPATAPVWIEDRRYHAVHLARFPYSVFLRKREREWIVVALTHQKRRPGHWKR